MIIMYVCIVQPLAMNCVISSGLSCVVVVCSNGRVCCCMRQNKKATMIRFSKTSRVKPNDF